MKNQKMKTNSTNKKQRRLKSATKSLKKNYKIYQKAKNEYFCVFLKCKIIENFKYFNYVYNYIFMF